MIPKRGNQRGNFSTNQGPSSGRPARQRRSTIIKTGGISWFEQLSDNEEITAPVDVSRELIKELRSKAEKLLQDDTQLYNQTHSYGDFAWIDRVLKVGTLADKMAAYTTLLQDSAVHNLSSLDSLLSLVSTKAKRECIMATETLRDLFTLTLLPANRKLKKFEKRPLLNLQELSSGNQTSMNRRLILWYFEDLLKDRYATFLQSLGNVLHDTVDKTKSKAISAIAQMLSANPEQEQLLLSSLVNKLGDPAGQVAGKVMYEVSKLLDQHPNMKSVVAHEIESFLYRPHLKERAQYYALCCLNQILLDKEDSDLVEHLTKIYLGFFRACLKNKNKNSKNKKVYEELDHRLMSATLTGLSRAVPFNQRNSSHLAEHTDSLFALIHKVPVNIRIQILALLFQIDESGSERFFCALYRSVLDPGLQFTSRQAVYLNLLYRCLRRDPAPLRVLAFIKRILQVCHYLSPPLACGLLILVDQLLQNRPEVALLKGSSKSSDQNINHFLDDSDGDEHYEDALEEEEFSGNNKEEEHDLPSSSSTVAKKTSSWVHLKNKAKHREDTGVYDLHHRNPLYSLGGRTTPFWELTSLSRHFHPSVALFAKNLTTKTNSDYCGDPLQDFTLIRFLERFVYRNPKKIDNDAGSGKFKKRSVLGKRKLYIPTGARKVAVQSKEYLQQSKSQIPEEERFLYDFMVLDSQRKKLEKAQDDDTLSVNSDDFEMMLNKTEPGSMDKMDFAKAVNKSNDKKSKRAADESDLDNCSEDDNDLGDFSDDEVDFENDEDFQAAFKEYDDDFGDSASEDLDSGSEKQISSNIKKSKKKKGTDLGDLFASAEQFSGMLEDEVDMGKSGNRSITADAVSNKDKAGAKQLEWERSRQPQQWRKKNPRQRSKHFRKTGGKLKARAK